VESPSDRVRQACAQFAALPGPILFLLFFAAVAVSHLTLLRLPYFWDEGGYYIPAALDFFHTGQLVPHFTNAHPPLPNILLGSLWHIVGYHIVATRLLICAFAAAGLSRHSHAADGNLSDLVCTELPRPCRYLRRGFYALGLCALSSACDLGRSLLSFRRRTLLSGCPCQGNVDP
jgi:hypothetical protein